MKTDKLFDIKPHPAYPERLRVMHAYYGMCEGEMCGNCTHFERYRQATTWFKCGLTRKTGGTGTDWRARWPACGKFEREE